MKIKNARYKSFGRPSDTLQVTVKLEEQLEALFDFSATIAVNGNKIMRNSFQLMNIKSKVLQGTA